MSRNADAALVRDLVRRLVEDWRLHFPEATAPPAVAQLEIIPRPLSTLGRLELAWEARRLSCFVKVHRKEGGDQARIRAKAKLEFDTLLDLSARLRDATGLGVPRPIAIFPEDLAVVTEAVPGERLHALVKRGARRWAGSAELATLAAHCRAAGTWLATVQDLTREEECRPLPAAGLLERIERDVAVCARHGLRDGAALVAACRARLEAVSEVPLPVVGVHPDFQPDNVMVAPGRVTVLDFTSFQPGPAVADPARFLVSLDFLAKSPLVSQRRLDALEVAFLDGYGRARLVPRPAFEVYVLRSIVRAARSALAWPYPAALRGLLARRVVRFVSDWRARLAAIGAIAAPEGPSR